MSNQPPPAPPTSGHTAELVLGGVLGGVLLVMGSLLGVALMTTTENGAIFFVGPVLALAPPVVLAARKATKWWGVGLLVGFFLTLIVLGGACVALIANFSG